MAPKKKMNIIIVNGSPETEIFLRLVNRIWPGKYNFEKTESALNQIINICAWEKNELIGCVRLLTDGYFFSTITEILVDPDFQRNGIGTQLLNRAFELSPSTLSFGVQNGNEDFFLKNGFKRGLDSYEKMKNRNTSSQ